MRKPKKRKMDILEGWGLGTSQQEEEATQESKELVPTQRWEWNDVNGSVLVDGSRKEAQANVTKWAEVIQEEVRNVPEERKVRKEEQKPPVKRKRGKLTKKEETEMKKRNKDISWLHHHQRK